MDGLEVEFGQVVFTKVQPGGGGTCNLGSPMGSGSLWWNNGCVMSEELINIGFFFNVHMGYVAVQII